MTVFRTLGWLTVGAAAVWLSGCAIFYPDGKQLNADLKASLQVSCSRETKGSYSSLDMERKCEQLAAQQQAAELRAQLQRCKEMKGSYSSAAVKQQCEDLAALQPEVERRALEAKKKWCEDIAFRADGGLQRPVELIPFFGIYTYWDRYIKVLSDDKAATFGKRGRKAYEECMAGP